MPTYSLGTGGYEEYMPSQFQGLGENITGSNLAGMFGLSGSEWGQEFNPFATSLMEMMQGAPGEMQRLTGEAGQAIGGAVRGAQTGLEGLSEKVTGMGKGFMGFGERGRATTTGRGAIQEKFGQEKAGIESTLLGKIRSNIEDPFTNLYGQLAGVYGGILAAGGTVEDDASSGAGVQGWQGGLPVFNQVPPSWNGDEIYVGNTRYTWDESTGSYVSGYKPRATGGETGGETGGTIGTDDTGDTGGFAGGGGYNIPKPWGLPEEKDPRGYYGTIY
jgi:hypothetical protein